MVVLGRFLQVVAAFLLPLNVYYGIDNGWSLVFAALNVATILLGEGIVRAARS